jgi:predicted metal-dependent HD superfamily phosphohydrolase
MGLRLGQDDAMRDPDPADARLLDAAVVAGGLGVKYTQPHRAYHNLLHVEDVLIRIEELAPPRDSELALALAAWFHDAIYQPDRNDNEERSAYVAFDAIEQVGGSPELIAEVVRLIRLTADHDPDPDDTAGGVLSDADLAILGSSREKYIQYSHAIREEYVHIRQDEYRAGRSQVLRSFLDRPHIYATGYAREHWEAQARDNLASELTCCDPDPS